MGVGELVGILCAGTAAFGNALANVMQRKASLEVHSEEAFSLRVLLSVIRRPTWVIGFSGMVASFLLQAVALGLAALAEIEPIITLEVPLTLLVAGRVFNARIGRGEWLAIFAMTGGMVALVAGLNPRPGDETHVDNMTYVIAGGATTATILALLAGGWRGPRMWRTACLGAAAGTCFGFTATLIKETVSQLETNGVVAVVTTWQTYAAMGFGVSGVLVMQWALHTGPLLASQPGFTLMDPIVSVLWGVLVYEEVTRTGWWLALATAGTAVLGVGVVMLARSPLLAAVSQQDDSPPHPEQPPHPGPPPHPATGLDALPAPAPRLSPRG